MISPAHDLTFQKDKPLKLQFLGFLSHRRLCTFCLGWAVAHVNLGCVHLCRKHLAARQSPSPPYGWYLP